MWHTNATFSASGIAYGNGKFVAVTGTSLQISPDGTNWTQYISPPVLNYEGIVFGGGVFMAFGYPVSTNSSVPRDRVGKEKPLCPQCGCRLKSVDELNEDDRAMADMQEWFASVRRDGLNGPSPIIAAEQLGCSRSMVDRLVERGILEKSEFTFKDRSVIIISRRSLEKAKENRSRTGNWTGHPVKRGS